MKIKECELLARNIIPPETQKRTNVQRFDFQKLLFEASQRISDPKPVDHTDPLLIRSQCFQAVEETLNTLEAYQKNLSAPEISLKKVDPIVQTLTEEVKTLQHLSGKLPLRDPLRTLMSEAGILSAVEIEKFRRGDYL